MDVGAGTDAGKDALFLGQASGHREGLVVGDGENLVDRIKVEVAGDESRTGSLDLVGARLHGLAGTCLGDDRGVLGLHRDGLEARLALLDHFGDAGDGAAGADCGDKDVDLAVGVLPDLLGGGLGVDGGVGGVVELLGHPGIRRLLEDLFGAGNGSLHSLGAGREDELRAEHGKQGAALHAHRLGHGENEFVTLGRGHEGKRDAGITAGRLHDGGAFLDQSLSLGIRDHGGTDTILHASERVEELALQRDRRGKPLGDVVEAHERGAADGVDDGVVNAAHGKWSGFTGGGVLFQKTRSNFYNGRAGRPIQY